MSDPVINPTGEPVATTSGEQDHVDPELYRGEDADAPEDTGRPADAEDAPEGDN
jgi:hypothetical protein